MPFIDPTSSLFIKLQKCGRRPRTFFADFSRGGQEQDASGGPVAAAMGTDRAASSLSAAAVVRSCCTANTASPD
jgi:hypothetical protein